MTTNLSPDNLGTQRDSDLKFEMFSEGWGCSSDGLHSILLKKKKIKLQSKFKTTKILKEIEQKARETTACEGS